MRLLILFALCLATSLIAAVSPVPKDVVVQVLYDRTELVDNVIDTVQHNLLAGALLGMGLFTLAVPVRRRTPVVQTGKRS